ncbi:MAG TPA: SH3 domain-containing protein, partial [Candidatus Dojkabacteria bacterium]|nr:SH3 domain-containing protein [Candidatus Dojkabacteria bacterium]
EKLIGDSSYQFGITKDKVKIVDMAMIKNTDSVVPTKTKLTEIHNAFSQNINQFIDGITFYDKEHINYQGEIVSVTYDKDAKAGDKMHVDVNIKNTNDFAWFTDKNYIYLTTTDFKDSPFAINGTWDSFSKPISIKKQTVLPGDTVKLSFDMQASLLPGKFTVKMGLTKDSKTIFKGTTFTMKLTVTRGNFSLVQVKDVPGGYLNVRSCPGNCPAISQVATGQVFIMKQKSLGWYQIVYSGTKMGWVYGQYIKEIQ